MTRLVCISDTHNLHKKLKLPDGDILVHSGDITGRGELDEVLRFVEWVATLLAKKKFKDVVWIAGNHDFLFENAKQDYVRSITKDAGIYLQHEQAVVQGLKFFGSPYTPEFFEWAFNLKRGAELSARWKQIPDDTDVLITHGPPYLIGDGIMRKGRTEYDPVGLKPGHVGCVDLVERVKELKPRLHQFGHIHEDYGRWEKDGTIYVNASSCNLHYEPVNEPIVVDL